MSALRGLAREARTVKRDQFQLAAALRCTIGVAIPLAIGVGSGAVADGVAAAVGALGAGFGSFQGAYRTRLATTLAVSVGMAVSAVLGALVVRNGAALVVVVAMWGLIAGMMTALGQSALVVGLQWVVALLVVGAIPMTLAQAVVRGAMVLVGGALQTLLVVVVWPLRSHAVERDALAGLYSRLATFAHQAQGGDGLAPGATELNTAGDVLGDPQPFSRRGDLVAFQALLDEAERIRIQLIALAQHRNRVAEPGGDLTPFAALAAHAALVLEAVSTAVDADGLPVAPPGIVDRLEEDCERIEHAAFRTPGSWVQAEAGAAARALAGQLRSAMRIAAASAGHPDAASFGDRPLPRRHRAAPAIGEGLVTLRANLSWQSASFRHAVRLAVVLAAATVVGRFATLPRGYWIPLTALVVLRQDFSSTAVRGMSRVAGTILGAAVATLITVWLKPGTAGLAVLFALAGFFAFFSVRANYALFTASVTSYVVFLLAFVKLPELTAVTDRLVDTLVGGALAVAAYLAWPTWESRLVGPELANLLEAQADYSGAVLAVFADPGSDRRRRLGEVRSAARLARSNAEASLARLAAEPAWSARSASISLDQAAGVLAAARRFVLGVLSLHAQLPPPSNEPYGEVEPLSRAIGGRLRGSAARLRTMIPRSAVLAGTSSVLERRRERGAEATASMPGSGPGDEPAESSGGRDGSPPSLRAHHGQMAEDLRARPGGLDNRAALLVAETDLLVDSVNTIAELLENPAPTARS